MEAPRWTPEPQRGRPEDRIVRIPDSLKSELPGVRRLELMVNTVFERLVAVDDPPDPHPPRAA